MTITELILQPFRRRSHSPTFSSLHLRHSSFPNPSVASRTSQLILQPFFLGAELILQPFRHFTYVTTHSPTLPSPYLCHSSFSNPSVASPTSQLILQPFFLGAELILQPFRHFTYVTAHSPTLPSLYLRHSSFSNHSVASPTSQLILQPFFRFSYVTSSSPGEPPMLLINKKIQKNTQTHISLTFFNFFFANCIFTK